MALMVVSLVGASTALGVERFPPPDFTDHKLPVTATPAPRTNLQEWIDVAALSTALVLASHLAIRRRSRRGVFALAVASLAYFGFYRKGCICSIGAIQNLALAIFDPTYLVPISAVAFFLLPLAFALFFGRTFCAAVCPLGAAQDVLLLKPVKVPRWLEQALGLLPFLYLGSAVLLAAMGAAFVICRYDPFVSFFRLSGSVNMLVFGACVLAAGMFVGRPYCRFACPYGALLRVASRLSKWHVSITPDECVRCRLCEDVCPFNAIDRPTAPPEEGRRGEGKFRLAVFIVLLPAMVVGGAWLVRQAGGFLSKSHATVRLAERLRLEETGQVTGAVNETIAFRSTGRPAEEAYRQADDLRARFRLGGMLLGGWIGLVVAGRLIALSIRRKRVDFLANRAACVSCGRCFKYCPREIIRLHGGKLPAPVGK